mmetsp:Transcript_19142/g.54365  ORF Transcript_19142/g.54365 Transcript_19142/m.54365 type:complete len:213 (+) Transcript_19142:424-1062(+)
MMMMTMPTTTESTVWTTSPPSTTTRTGSCLSTRYPSRSRNRNDPRPPKVGHPPQRNLRSVAVPASGRRKKRRKRKRRRNDRHPQRQQQPPGRARSRRNLSMRSLGPSMRWTRRSSPIRGKSTTMPTTMPTPKMPLQIICRTTTPTRKMTDFSSGTNTTTRPTTILSRSHSVANPGSGKSAKRARGPTAQYLGLQCRHRLWMTTTPTATAMEN